jgi:hypothetical protein
MPLKSKHQNRNQRLVDTSLNMVAFDKFYINIDSKFNFKIIKMYNREFWIWQWKIKLFICINWRSKSKSFAASSLIILRKHAISVISN